MTDVVSDIMWCLGKQYFGMKRMSLSVYWHLIRLMYGRKIGSQLVCEYYARLEKLDYVSAKVSSVYLGSNRRDHKKNDRSRKTSNS